MWVVARDGMPRVDYVLAFKNAGLAADEATTPGFASTLAGQLSDGTDRAKLAAAIAPSGRLVGLVEVKNGRTRVVTNFPTAEAGSGAPAVPSANAGAGSEPTA